MRPLSISESAKKIFPIHTKRELIDISIFINLYDNYILFIII